MGAGCHHRDRYWLVVVYNCDTTPETYTILDHFGNLLARLTGAVRIPASQVIANAQAQSDLP